MPTIKPLSEFSRNQNALIEEMATSGEPIYLTKNGSACVVVMDATAFDNVMSFRDEIREQELATYRGIMQGYQDIVEGNVVDADKSDALIRNEKGWD